MNKKAALGGNWFAWIRHLIFLIIVTSALIIMILSFTKYEINTSNLETDIFMARVLYQSDLISYEKNSRVYPNIIDYEKFENKDETEIKIMKAINYGNEEKSENKKLFNNHISALISLELDGEVKEIYYNELLHNKISKIYRTQKNLGDKFKTDKKGVYGINQKLHVQVLKDNKLKQGILSFEVVKPISEAQYAITK